MSKSFAMLLLIVLSATTLRAQPTLVDALSLGNPAGDVVVVYSGQVDPASGTNAANYVLDNGASVTAARLGSDGKTVILGTTNFIGAPGLYTVTVNNVQDTGGNPIASDSMMPLEQGLNTWLQLDERSGTVANDSSGNGNNGMLSNFSVLNNINPNYAGKVALSDKFGGNGGYIALTNATAYSNFSGGLTFSLWVDPTTEGANANWARFIDLSRGAAADNILFSRNFVSNSIAFQMYYGAAAGYQVLTPPGTLLTNQWQHIAVTLDDSGNVAIYVNGVMVDSDVIDLIDLAQTNRNMAFIGRSPWAPDSYYAGRMDDVRIYNRALDPEAIYALASGGGPDDINPAVPVIGVVASTNTTAEHGTAPGAFTFTRTGNTNSSVTVQYAITGSAVNGTDYVAITNSITFPTNAVSETVLVTPLDFAFSDAFRTVTLTLSNLTSYAINYTNGASDSDTVTIFNNDSSTPPAPVTATADNYSTYPTTVNVWFNEAVYSGTALNLTNYSLNVSGLTITNATTLGAYSVGVMLYVDGNVPTNAMLTVSGVTQGPAGSSGTYQIPVYSLLSPVNLVAPAYHVVGQSRSATFNVVNDGVTALNNANGATGVDDWWWGAGTNINQVGWNNFSQFLGMIYGTAVDIRAIKVDLGQQFGDGGSWAAQPKVYILKNPVDTGTTHPDTDTNDWVQVPASLVSASQFSPDVTVQTTAGNTPIVFDLSAVPENLRTGYGWAVGGVPGAGASQFLSYSELRGYGFAETNVAVTNLPTQNLTVSEGESTPLSAIIGTTIPGAYQWYEDGNQISGATDDHYNVPGGVPDGAHQYSVTITYGSFSVTKIIANLTVVAQTNSPQVVDAVLAPNRTNIDLWFSQPMSATSTANLSSYVLNDPNMAVTTATQDVKGYLVSLAYSGYQTVSNLMITVTNVMDNYGNTCTSQVVAVQAPAWPVNRVLADAYQGSRANFLVLSTNGIVDHSDGAQWWQTYGGTPVFWSSFVGLTYPVPQTFGVVRVDLGNIFVDGGDWAKQPKVYVLKNNVDTSQLAPENDPNDWVLVPGARLISGSVFQTAIDGGVAFSPETNTNGPIAFDLSAVPTALRTGYGWAVGGVPGQGASSFLSISELGASLAPASPQLKISQLGDSIVISWPSVYTSYTLQTSAALGLAAAWSDVGATIQVQNGYNVVTIPISGSAAFYRLH